MAARTVEVEELMNTVLVCDVCMESFNSGTRVPLLLPCHHSFCLSCLESLSKGGDFRCPTCRHLVTVSGPVATSLPKDIISLKVVDYLTMKSSAQKVPCTDCVDKNTASFRCLTCHLNLCQACQDGHRRVPFFRSHTVRSLEELAAAPGDFLAEAETCGEHVGVALNLYCDSQACKVALCTSCAMVAHRQDSHSIMDLSTVHERAKREHAELLALLEKEEERKRGVLEDVKKKAELVETSAATATDQVNQAMDRLLQAVEERRKRLLQEVGQIKDRQAAELKKMEEETSSHVGQIQEAAGYLRRAERLSRQAEFISVVHVQGPSVRKLAPINHFTKSFLGDYPGLYFFPIWTDPIQFEAFDEGTTVKALGSVRDRWGFPVSATQTKCDQDQPQTPVRSPSKDGEDERVDEYEPNVDFKPVIALPELVPTLTGEENEEKVFGERARLFRFDSDTSQWKERGIGELKILHTPSTNQVRILMRREQVLKVCANHKLTPDIRLTPMPSSDRAWCWAAMDYAEETLQMEKFAAKFKTPELALVFKEKFQACQRMLGESVAAAKDTVDSGKKSQPVSSSEVSSTSVETVGPAGSGLSLAEQFQPQAGSWECQGCYIQNPSTVLQCPACQSLKPGVSPDQVRGQPKSEDKKPSFQFGAAPTIQSSGFTFGSGAVPSQPSQSTSLSELLKRDESSWECNGCLLSNKADVLRCPACQALKPRVKPEDVKDTGSGVKAGSAAALSGGFQFGSAEKSSAAPAQTGGFQFGSGGGFQFGSSGGF